MSSATTSATLRPDKIRGCLLAGAVGDALGAPVEFLKRATIISRYGADGIRDYSEAFGRLGAITDDTQMTLFTAEGLIRACLASNSVDRKLVVSEVTAAYLRWYETQTQRLGQGATSSPSSWLLSQRELYSRRAPGITCMSALQRLNQTGELEINNSKGCGSVMRVAPSLKDSRGSHGTMPTISRSHQAGSRESSKTTSEQHVTEAAVLPSEIERLPDLAGFPKLASSQSWQRVRIPLRRR
jgi:ADP-ribosylglycohydrolase